MVLNIPTVNWSVCWPCREYFKSSKCFQKHNVIVHGVAVKDCATKTGLLDDSPEKENTLENSVVGAELVFSDNDVRIVNPEVKTITPAEQVPSPISTELSPTADRSNNSDQPRNDLSMSPGHTLRKRAIISYFPTTKRATPSRRGSNHRTLRKRTIKIAARAKPSRLLLAVKRSRKSRIATVTNKTKPANAAEKIEAQTTSKSTQSSRNQPLTQVKPKQSEISLSVATSELVASQRAPPLQVKPKDYLKTPGRILRVRKQPNLTDAVETLPGSPRFPCKLCGKSFLQVRSLKRHEKAHVVDKPLNCQVCGKSVKLKPVTLVMKRCGRYVTKKPACCSFCGSRFNHD